MSGGYVGGASRLQGACGVPLIARNAFAPPCVRPEEIIDAEGAYSLAYQVRSPYQTPHAGGLTRQCII